MPAAGGGRRFGGELPKQYASLAGRKVLEWSLAPFLADARCVGIVVALGEGDTTFQTLSVAADPRMKCVVGGAHRSDSVRAALSALRCADDHSVLVHDAARPCLASTDIDALLVAAADCDEGGLLALPMSDTVKRGTGNALVEQTMAREHLWRALTPQLFRVGVLRRALLQAVTRGLVPTDEAQAVEWLGLSPRLISGSALNIKITERSDLLLAEAILRPRGEDMSIRVGTGVDVHAFGPGNSLMLGGVEVPHSQGVVAHSDGDVLLHALCDALLGAAALGDIGQHFPDTDPQWQGADSSRFVAAVRDMLSARGYQLVNADLTLLAERPRIGAYRQQICERVAALLQVEVDRINLKATTTEKLGFIGKGEGLAAMAAVTLRKRS
jgi:2-C-methyl-D-erythritol 4-phosphate cytidylyltransferase / 2-C-methyl-D-erythritol 2,4-cyclodiphosphate synthase